MTHLKRGDVAAEVEPWADCRIKCGIGHVYRGRVRRVQRQGYDMDGEGVLYPPEDEFEPETCVVCGLKAWSRVE